MSWLRALLLSLGLAAPVAKPLQVQTLEVSRSEASYRVTVNVLIDAAPERVRATLLDASVFPKLDPSIKAARASESAGGQRVESELEECLFGFCRRLLHVQQVEAQGMQITAQTLPVAGSSFRSGLAQWQLAAEGEATRLIFTADTEPAFWLPPVFGPRALMTQLREKTLASLQVLEQIARE